MTKHSLLQPLQAVIYTFQAGLAKSFKLFGWLVGFVRERAWGNEENRDTRNEGKQLDGFPEKILDS